MGKFLRNMRRRLGRAAIAAATLAAVAACAVGVPQPAVVSKSHAERYPCENHPCGCHDAASCWRDCCCYSNGEKLAWAERVGVTPPPFVIAAARAEQAQVCDAKARGDEAEWGCRPQRSCCSKRLAALTCEPAAESADAAKTPSRQGGWIMLHAAMKCRGLTVSVALLPPSLPAAIEESFERPIVRFASPTAAPLLYEPPCFGIATPPPDALFS